MSIPVTCIFLEEPEMTTMYMELGNETTYYENSTEMTTAFTTETYTEEVLTTESPWQHPHPAFAHYQCKPGTVGCMTCDKQLTKYSKYKRKLDQGHICGQMQDVSTGKGQLT